MERRRTLARIPIAVSVLLAGVTAGCSPEALAPPGRAGIEEVSGAIVGGTLAPENNFSAAVYSQIFLNGSWTWFSRPCTGVVLRVIPGAVAPGTTQVLTARHCITSDGGDARSQNITPASRIRVSTALAPGLPNPSPPASAKQADTVQSSSTIISYGMKKSPSSPSFDYNYYGDDLAVIGIGESLFLTPMPAGVFPTLGLRMSPVQVGTPLYAEGYGQVTADSNTGAGVLRYGYWYDVQYIGPSGFAYNYVNSSSNGARKVWHGDSGGGDFTYETIDTANGPLGVWELAGIHSSISIDGTIETSGVALGRDDFLLDTIGFFYASPVDSPSINLCISSETPAVATQLKANCTGDSTRTRWAFSRTTGMMQIYQEPPPFSPPPPPLCLEQQTNNLLKLHTCSPSSTRQQWVVLEDHEIQNVATGKCITFAATPTVGNCDGASSRKWIWHPGL